MTAATTIPLPQLLTHSRMSEMKRCLRRHWFRYEIGLVRDRDEQPLRLGSSVHLGLDLIGKGVSVDDAIAKAIEGYAVVPAWCQTDDDLLDWQVERATVSEMIRGYSARWTGDGAEIVASEFEFNIAITNPETGAATPLFTFAGKIDKIVKLSDGRVAVREHKTTGDSIEDPAGQYWKRLRIDQQISGYFMGARALGHDIQTVEYDVLKKPGIRPKLIKGVRETAEQYQDRLRQDIAERPEFYYARQEIPRLDADLTEFQQELWDIQQALRSYQKRGVWFRNTAACTIMGTCPFFELCTSGFKPDGNVPAGFKRLENINHELNGVLTHDRRTTI